MKRARVAHADEPAVRLPLHGARSTPNLVGAAHKPSAVLDQLDGALALSSTEIGDVFSEPKRAITDGVVITPTLIGQAVGRRIALMGDLADRARLKGALTICCASASCPADAAIRMRASSLGLGYWASG